MISPTFVCALFNLSQQSLSWIVESCLFLSILSSINVLLSVNHSVKIIRLKIYYPFKCFQCSKENVKFLKRIAICAPITNYQLYL